MGHIDLASPIAHLVSQEHAEQDRDPPRAHHQEVEKGPRFQMYIVIDGGPSQYEYRQTHH